MAWVEQWESFKKHVFKDKANKFLGFKFRFCNKRHSTKHYTIGNALKK